MFAWRRTALRRRVVVNLKSGKSFAGYLTAQRGPLLVLKAATMIGAGTPEPVPVDGEVVVERSAVDFVQVLPVPEG